jgi:ABC-2 type transport system ATP-binding protein
MHQGRLVLHDSIAGLQHRLHGASLFLRTQQPLDTERLSGLDDVIAVEPLTPVSCRVHYRLLHNPADRLAAAVSDAGWGLLELVPERKTLEELFVALLNDDREAP